MPTVKVEGTFVALVQTGRTKSLPPRAKIQVRLTPNVDSILATKLRRKVTGRGDVGIARLQFVRQSRLGELEIIFVDA